MARSMHEAQYERHAVHLINRILTVRPHVSPFTLVLDDLNQRASLLLEEILRRGISRDIKVIAISFERANWPSGIEVVPGFDPKLNREEILQDLELKLNASSENLVVVDSLPDLIVDKGIDISTLFSIVAGKYSSTLLGVYHTDLLPATQPGAINDSLNTYKAPLLEVLKFTATTILTCRSFAHVLATKAALSRSLAAPTHGLLQGADGIVDCLLANDKRGIVLDAEFRRKSGRPEHISYFLRRSQTSDYPAADKAAGTSGPLKAEFVMLLEKHPAFRSARVRGLEDRGADAQSARDGDEQQSTFNLGLTEKQRAARDGVVLPYFDAQKGEGGEGGRILYDMGEEDDFDEEEDEI